MTFIRSSVANRNDLSCFTLRSVSGSRLSNVLRAAPDGKNKVVVIGGGWAGFGAAKHLCDQSYNVTLLDAASNPGGLSTGMRTPQGRSIEAGMKGFWYQYHNIFALVKELGIDNPFTEFTRSGFWCPEGLTTEGPVFSELPQYPTLLGQFIHTTRLFKRVSLVDQLSMFNMLFPVVDFNSDPKTYTKYDQMTARELFLRTGISENLYNEFLKPLLLVGLFAPPEEISAASMLETMYFYALAHQNDFDICWCRGSVAEKLFTPLVQRIKSSGGDVLGNQIVIDLVEGSNGIQSVIAKDTQTGTQTVYEADAVILAISIKGMKKLMSSCTALSKREEFQKIMNLKGIDVMATRLWFDKDVSTKFPSNVLARFEKDVGGTYFNLTQLQDEYKNEKGTVIAVDFYHSNKLMLKTDEQVLKDVQSYLGQCEDGFKSANIVDGAVLRYYGAVTHFSPGSYASRPTQKTTLDNLFLAGDWVKGVQHGANGLSQERAYVTGLIAANEVIRKMQRGVPAKILDVEPDEPHIATLKTINKNLKKQLRQIGFESPLFPW
eukprot:g1497.t1